MSNLYETLQSVQGGRLPSGNELIDDHRPSSLSSQTCHNHLPIPRFHENSELLALAQNIAARLPNPDQNVIQFISSQAGEGTSTLIREFALTVAQHSSKPVLLVEADSQQPSQAHAFSLQAKPPLDYALKEGNPLNGVISQIEQSNMFLATLSPYFFRSLPERSFSHSTDMWKAARSQFSLILIDSAPVNVSADSLALCKSVNGVILVVAAQQTRSAIVQNVKNQILAREGHILGIVYTKKKFHIPKSIYNFL